MTITVVNHKGHGVLALIGDARGRQFVPVWLDKVDYPKDEMIQRVYDNFTASQPGVECCVHYMEHEDHHAAMACDALGDWRVVCCVPVRKEG